MLKFEKPIVFFDLETTGTSTVYDRIVSIATTKYFPGEATPEKKKRFINPGMPIPAAATEVHGITDEMVKDKPTFKQIAQSMCEYMQGCDLGGFNSNRFDIPLLIEEFNRCNIDFPTWKVNTVDVMLYHLTLFPNTLSALYERLFNEPLDGAHDAGADIDATVRILKKYANDQPGFITPAQIDEFCQGDKRRVDFAGAMYRKGETVFWSVGKNKDKDVLADRGYINWFIDKSDFPKESKRCLKSIVDAAK